MHGDACINFADLIRHRCHRACAIPCDQPQLLPRYIPALRSTDALLDMRYELFSMHNHNRAGCCLDGVCLDESNRGVLKFALCKAIVFSFDFLEANFSFSVELTLRRPANW